MSNAMVVVAIGIGVMVGIRMLPPVRDRRGLRAWVGRMLHESPWFWDARWRSTALRMIGGELPSIEEIEARLALDDTEAEALRASVRVDRAAVIEFRALVREEFGHLRQRFRGRWLIEGLIRERRQHVISELAWVDAALRQLDSKGAA